MFTTRSNTLFGAIAAAALLTACGQGGSNQNANNNGNTANANASAQAQENTGSGDNSAQNESYGRAQVRIVGSSTVYPFSSYVAEELGATTEAMGSGLTFDTTTDVARLTG